MLFEADDGTLGFELYVSNGTVAGTHLLSDIYPGPASSDIRNMTRVGSQAFFTADDGTDGDELWVTDGTSAGTHLVLDIYP